MASLPPLLFIHGAHCDARVWRAGFLQSFEQRGFTCHAIDLPGHGARRREPDFDRLGLADYVTAIRVAADALAQPPLLVGHSMGGYLAQDLALSGGRVAGLALLASAPAHGMVRDLLAFAMRHPLLAMRMEFNRRESDEQRHRRVRDALMTSDTPPATVLLMEQLLQRESARALRELGIRTLHPRPLPVPVLAIAGAQDKLVSVASQRATAQGFGVPLTVYPDMAHMLQIEPGWQRVADQLAGFAQTLAGEPVPPA